MLLAITILFASLGATTATDTLENNTNTEIDATTPVTIEKTTPIEESSTYSIEKDTAVQKDKKILKADNTQTINITSYPELNTALTNPTTDNVTINIQNNITLAGNTRVNSAIKNLTINGNQKTINGNGQYQFLNIPSTTSVLIDNIIITNCTARTGGAIYNRGTLTITASTVSNNTAKSTGGAVYTTNSTVTVEDSLFENNIALGENTEVRYTNITYIINGTTYNGNATGINNIRLFDDNTVLLGEGITISINGTHLTQGDEEDNDRLASGVVLSDGTIYLPWYTNLTINNNKILVPNGTMIVTDGIIMLENGRFITTNINRSNANSLNGTITIPNSKVILPGDYPLFDDINVTIQLDDGIISHGVGGAITGYTDTTIIITNSTLTNNNATTYGGAITGWDNNNITITQTNLTHNNAGSNGGAIYGFTNNTITINNTNLTNNNAERYGGAIYGHIKSTITINNTNLTNNNANYGGAIYNRRNATACIVGSDVSNNVANGSGGAVYNFNGTVTVENSVFDSNVALGEPSEVRYENATYVINGVEHNGNATGIGNVILFDDNAVLLRSSIININGTPLTIGDEESDRLGSGAVLANGILYLPWDTNITINQNNVLVPNGTMIVTDGIIILEDGRIITTDITKSNANSLNGTITLPDSKIILPNGTVLFDKTNISIRLDDGIPSGNGGGAINNDYNASLTITNTNFTNNLAVKENGGAIINQMNSTMTITDSRIENNTANMTGGAISTDTNSSMTLENSRLTNNINSEDDFVVDFSNADNIVISGNTFVNNTDNVQDMLFSDTKDDAKVDIHDNTYIDNLLETFSIDPEIPVITNTTPGTYNYYIDLTLRDIYNDTPRNGNLTIYINGKKSGHLRSCKWSIQNSH